MRPTYLTNLATWQQNSEIGHMNWNRVYPKDSIIILFWLRWGPYQKMKIKGNNEKEKKNYQVKV